MHALQAVLDALERRELIVQSGEAPPLFLPARDPGLITVAQVLDTARAAGEEGFLTPQSLPVPAHVERLIARLQQAVDGAVGAMTLRDLAAAGTGDLSAPAEAAGDATQQRPTPPSL